LNSTTYSYANQKYIFELQEMAALSEALAITEFNLHGGDNQSKRTMKKMAKPEWFDFRRKINQTKTLVSECTKIDQVSSNNVVSADLLLSSTNQLAVRYLPYLELMGMLKNTSSLAPLSEIADYSKKQSRNESGFDNSELVNDEQDKQFLDQLSKKRQWKQKSEKMKQAKDGFASRSEVEGKCAKIVEEEIEDSDLELNDDDIEDALDELDADDFSIDDEDLKEAVKPDE